MVRAYLVAIVLAAAAFAGCVFHNSDDDADDDQTDPCIDLDPASCRNTTGCAVDVCFACSCAPSYVGCRRETDAAHECPQLGCPTPLCCDSQTDCDGAGFSCVGRDDPPGCGACNNDPGSCTTDADCGGPSNGMICEPIRCSCTGVSTCATGCNVGADCGVGQACDQATHRCVGSPCSSSANCLPNYTCTDGACAPTPCTDDTACDGFCVNGTCQDTLGECRPPVP